MVATSRSREGEGRRRISSVRTKCSCSNRGCCNARAVAGPLSKVRRIRQEVSGRCGCNRTSAESGCAIHKGNGPGWEEGSGIYESRKGDARSYRDAGGRSGKDRLNRWGLVYNLRNARTRCAVKIRIAAVDGGNGMRASDEG